MGFEYITLETLKKSDKAIIEVAMMDDYPERVVVKHLKGVNINLFHQISFLHSVYIPKIYKCELDGEWFVVIEEYLEGENLEKYLREHRLTDKQKLDIALQLCEAVKCLHALQPPIIHRDIKPHNIIVNEHGALKLIDFDASRYYREDDNRQDTRLLGTPEYAPPEQYGYSQTDVRSDIYSMGMVFKELNLTEKKFLVSEWEKMVGKCRNFDPKHRYQTVDELEKEIKKMAFLRTITGKTVLGWTAAVLLLLIVLWQGCMLTRNNDAGASNQNEVTGMPTPTEVVQESVTLEPKATSTPVPTETPTQAVEPTAEPTATNTPVPTETPTPVPTEMPASVNSLIPGVETVEELDAYFASTNLYVYNFYRSIAEQTKFYIGVDSLLDTSWKFDKITFTNYETGVEVEVPASMIDLESEIISVSNDFLLGLEDTYYQVIIYITNGESSLPAMSTVVKVSEAVDETGHIRALGRDWVTFYTQYPTDIIITSNSENVLKMEKLYICQSGIYPDGIPEILDAEILTEVNPADYEIMDAGKMMRLSKELLAGYSNESRVIFAALCNDGNYWRIVVEYDNGKPYWMPQ